MKQEEIIEGNKLIAKFMGHSQDDHLYGMVIDDKYYTYTLMKYHSSWDWLMPVVKLCWEKTIEFQYDDEEYLHITEDIFHPDYSLSEFMNGNIESIWYRVISFIKWYNGKDK